MRIFETQDTTIIAPAAFQSKNVELSFRLINEDGIFQSGLTDDEWNELKAVFSAFDPFEIAVWPPVLIVRVQSLPPKPWPLSVAGLPLKFTTHDTDSCFKSGKIGGTNGALPLPDLRRTRFEAEMLDQVVDYLLDDLEINVKRVTWFGSCWRITISDDTDLATLPRTFFHVLAEYHFISELPYPNPAALRLVKPAGTVYDDTRYDIHGYRLRPGIMISSGIFEKMENGQKLESWSSATAGVLVQDDAGTKFMTIPTHILRDSESRDVYHPDPKKGVVIGTAVQDLDETDITLVKLKSDITFENITFETELQDATQITSIKDFKYLRIADNIWMNNPYTGICDGQHRGESRRIEGFPRDTRRYREIYLAFENHVATQPIAGSCGSAIIHEDGQLVGFFHFLAEDGFCISVSAEELTKRGFTIAV